MTIGEKIEDLIIDLGISKQDFAKKLEVRQSTVSNWLADTREPRVGTVIRICKIFNVSADWILRGEEDEKGADKHR